MSEKTYKELGAIFDYHLQQLEAVKTKLDFPENHFKIRVK